MRHGAGISMQLQLVTVRTTYSWTDKAITNRRFRPYLPVVRRCLVESEEQFGYMISVKSLLNNGFDANAGYDPNEDRAALYCASRYGHAETVRTLLDHGADVNAQDFVGGTALDVAAHEGQLHVIQLIINHAVHFNVSEGYHESALKAAAYNGHLRVVEYLLDVVEYMNIGTNRSRTGANGDQINGLYTARAAGRIGPSREYELGNQGDSAPA
ncbi:hypothetical protein E4T41_06026 [Aureobasidium subglaciale]|nr:hypothetical protein E4T41_06026 [Aureobasidium subglaciale]